MSLTEWRGNLRACSGGVLCLFKRLTRLVTKPDGISRLTIAVVIVLLSLSACRQKRPYGTERLGRIEDLLGAETYLERNHFLVRRDQVGFSVMSTLCTLDLSPLLMRHSEDGQCELVSRRTSSKYDCYGKVLNGPAKHDLPYYEIFAAPGEYEQRKADTLYVWIGKEKPPAWRFRIGR